MHGAPEQVTVVGRALISDKPGLYGLLCTARSLGSQAAAILKRTLTY
jgi:hypothetical protein